MRKSRLLLFISGFVCASFFFSCSKENDDLQPDENKSSDTSQVDPIKASLWEKFENSAKTAYSPSSLSLPSGSWYFDDALIGSSPEDRKTGSKSIRIRNTGKITMLFDKAKGAGTVQVKHAIYGNDGSSTWELWASINSGSTWKKIGNTINSESTDLITIKFNINDTKNHRFEIRKTGGGSNRINIDDFAVSDYTNVTPEDTIVVIPDGEDGHMLLGNINDASSNIINANNYLMVKPQYCLSYNNSKQTANWTSWHLTSTDFGSTPRQDDFRADALPSDWYEVQSGDFSGFGFDRGHLCPSADRTSSVINNSATFLMTNMIPQAPNNNQIPWENLESYSRSLVNAGNELYIISGPYGQGGIGSAGFKTTIGNGIVVPEKIWKIIVVMPKGSSDLSRITNATRVIAVLIPNSQTASDQPWHYYRVSVDAIENLTGLDFMDNVSTTIQSVIESNVDSGETQ